MRTRVLGLMLIALLIVFAVSAQPPAPQDKSGMPSTARPTDGYTVHVLAPHVVKGKVMGPFHHYCKIISPEPIIQCQIYDSTDANAPLTQIEYIVAKSIPRS